MGDRLAPSVSQEVTHLLLTMSTYRQLCVCPGYSRLLPSPLLLTGISCLSPFRTTHLLSSLPISSPSALGLLGISISRKSKKPHSCGLHCGLCPHLLGPREVGRRGGWLAASCELSALVSPSFAGTLRSSTLQPFSFYSSRSL